MSKKKNKTNKSEVALLRSEVKELKEYKNAISMGNNAVTGIDDQTVFRYRQTQADWEYSLSAVEAKEKDTATWNPLFDIYRNMLMDAKLSSELEIRFRKTIRQPFKLFDINSEEVDEELTKEWNRKWFRTFEKESLNAKLWGFSLIQLHDITNDVTPDKVSLQDRYTIIPERKEIRQTSLDDNTGESFEGNDWVVWVTDYDENKVTDFGLFAKLAYVFLTKKEILSSMAERIEVNGAPLRIAKLGPGSDKANIREAMMSMGSNFWAVVDENTEIELKEANDIGADNIYMGAINYLDSCMSSLIHGGDISGSGNYSENNSYDKLMADTSMLDNLFIQDIVNDQLIPQLISIGAKGYENIRFEFYYKENVDLKSEFDFVKGLLPYYDIDPDYLENKFGVKILGIKETPGEVQPEEEDDEDTNLKKMNNYYNGKS